MSNLNSRVMQGISIVMQHHTSYHNACKLFELLNGQVAYRLSISPLPVEFSASIRTQHHTL